MSKYTVDSPDFKTNTLTVEIESFFKGPALKLNGAVVKLKRGKATIKDDSWGQREVTLKTKLHDLPSVFIDRVEYFPLGRLSKVDQVFVVLPLGLLAVGGAVGGGLGGLAAYSNSLLMREYKDSNLKYVLTLVTSGLAFICWYFIAIMLNTMMGRQ